MATTVTKTRTNYFAVTDREAFQELVGRIETNDGKAFVIDNEKGEVGFCVDGAVLGMRPGPSEEVVEEMKEEIYNCGVSEVCKFAGRPVDYEDKEAAMAAIDAAMKKLSDEELYDAAAYYVGMAKPEPDDMEDEMVRQIQGLLMPGHACIITDISYENLRSLDASSLVITKDGAKWVMIWEEAVNRAKVLLDCLEYETDVVY